MLRSGLVPEAVAPFVWVTVPSAPGQAQKAHAHAGSDKVYAVLEGKVHARVSGEEQELQAGQAVLAPAGSEHGIENRSGARAAVLVLMAPRPL